MKRGRRSKKTVRELGLWSVAALSIDDARMYGLLQGGPTVNRERCEELLKKATDAGHTYEPEEVTAASVALINQWNATQEEPCPPPSPATDAS